MIRTWFCNRILLGCRAFPVVLGASVLVASLAGLPLVSSAADGDYFVVRSKERTCDDSASPAEAGEVVTGHVLDGEGRGLPGVRVQIIAVHAPAPWSAENTTDDAGSYRFAVTKGDFALRVTSGDSEVADELLTWSPANAAACQWQVTFQKGTRTTPTPQPQGRVSAPIQVVPIAEGPIGTMNITTPTPATPTATPTPAAPPVLNRGPWSAPVKLSLPQPSGDDAGWLPDVAADDSGNVHVVWSGTTEDPPGRQQPKGKLPRAGLEGRGGLPALFYTRGNGKEWTPPNDIALITPSTAVVRSALAVDQSGQVHLLYRGVDPSGEEGGLDAAIRHASSPASGGERAASWAPSHVVDRRGLSYFPDIAIDSNGILHAIWTAYDGQCCWALYYSRSTDGGKKWSPAYLLEDKQAVYWFRAQIQVDWRDRLHVVWELTDPDATWAADVTWGMAYATSNDGGTTWLRTVPFPMPDPRLPAFTLPQQPRIGVDGLGQILLVWRGADDLVYYQHSQDGVHWSEPMRLAGVQAGVRRPFDVYDMATDSAGHVHLVMVGYETQSTTMSLLHIEWDGKHWLAPHVITNSPPYPEYPKIAIGNGNQLHVVWFAGDIAWTNRTPTGIWYSTATVSAPRVERSPVAELPAGTRRETPLAVSSGTSTPAPTGIPPEMAMPSEATSRPATVLPSWLDAVQQRTDFPLIAGITPVLVLLIVIATTRSGLIVGSESRRDRSTAQRRRGDDGQ